MSGLTPIGTVHTAISIVALVCGIISFVRDKEISPFKITGRIYVVTTIFTCITGFFIFQHGGFGAPHVVGIITLVVLAIASAAQTPRYFGRLSPYIQTVSYSTTFFLHMVPAVTETTTRLPVGAPLIANRDSPVLQAAAGVMLPLLVIGSAIQVRRLKSARKMNSLPNSIDVVRATV